MLREIALTIVLFSVPVNEKHFASYHRGHREGTENTEKKIIKRNSS